VSLLGTRVCGTSTDDHPEHLVGTSCNHKPLRLVNNDRDLGAHGHVKESLSDTRRPAFISTVRSDLAQATHRLEGEDTLGDIRTHKRMFETQEGLPVT